MADAEKPPADELRETDVGDTGNGSTNPPHDNEIDDELRRVGESDGEDNPDTRINAGGEEFDEEDSPDTRLNAVPRRFPHSSSPTPGRGGYLPVPTDSYSPTPGHGGYQPTDSYSPTPGRGGYRPVPTDPSLSHRPGRKPVDVNLYATKKTVCQGMMDLALITANASQLRSVLEGAYGSNYYYFNIVLICLSILFQVAIGIVLIFIGRYNVQEEEHAQKADKLNNWVVMGIFLITIVNLFITSFTGGISVHNDHNQNTKYSN